MSTKIQRAFQMCPGREPTGARQSRSGTGKDCRLAENGSSKAGNGSKIEGNGLYGLRSSAPVQRIVQRKVSPNERRQNRHPRGRPVGILQSERPEDTTASGCFSRSEDTRTRSRQPSFGLDFNSGRCKTKPRVSHGYASIFPEKEPRTPVQNLLKKLEIETPPFHPTDFGTATRRPS